MQTSGGCDRTGAPGASASCHRISHDSENGTEYSLKTSVWIHVIKVHDAGAVCEAIEG